MQVWFLMDSQQSNDLCSDGYCTPENEVDSDIFASWELLHENIGGILSYEVSDIKDTDQQTKFLSHKVGLANNAIGGSSRDGLDRKELDTEEDMLPWRLTFLSTNWRPLMINITMIIRISIFRNTRFSSSFVYGSNSP
jgi:hypothetical protein